MRGSETIGFITSSIIPDFTAGDNIYSSQIFDELVNAVDGDGLVKIQFDRQNLKTHLTGLIFKAPLLILGLFLPYMWLNSMTWRNLFVLYKESRKCDVILVDHFRCAWSILFVATISIFDPKTYVYISHNIESDVSRLAAIGDSSLLNVPIRKFEYYKLYFWELLIYKFISKASYITDVDSERATNFFGTHNSITLAPYSTLVPLQ